MVGSAPSKENINALKEIGFEEGLIIEALQKCDNNRERATEWILSRMTGTQSVAFGPNPQVGPSKNEDDELSKAVELSLMCNNQNQNIVENRDPSLPLGLRNNGNIPYFTSLVQLLYSVGKFKRSVLDSQAPGNVLDPHKKKIVKMLGEVKNVFRLMDSSKKKFEDSSQVFSAYSDIDGVYQIDNQKNDVADYLLKIVARVEEGLRLSSQENDSVPLRKDSMNFLLENPIISDLFYGKMVPLTYYKESEEKREKKQGPEVLFGKFEVEAEHKELYEAWEKSMTKKLSNYPVGDTTTPAKQHYWIQNLPKILIFDIKRQHFDPQGNPIKSKKAFGFPEKLHPGRFLFENQAKSSKLQKSMRANKRKVKSLEKAIEKFENFNGTDLNISHMLNFCSEFLHGQERNFEACEGGNSEDSGPRSLIQILNNGDEDESVVLEGRSKEDLLVTCNVVKSYAQKVDENLSKMKNQLESLNCEIETAFSNEKFSSIEYELTAVIVHDGDVGSGQFYSYMQNNGQWKKFNDINVTEATFKEVLFHSLGEYGISAACCLVYSLKET